MNKLRELTKRQNESSPEDFAAVIWGCEIDESYIGGKNKNRHKNKKVENVKEEAIKIRFQYLVFFKETAN